MFRGGPTDEEGHRNREDKRQPADGIRGRKLNARERADTRRTTIEENDRTHQVLSELEYVAGLFTGKNH